MYRLKIIKHFIHSFIHSGHLKSNFRNFWFLNDSNFRRVWFRIPSVIILLSQRYLRISFGFKTNCDCKSKDFHRKSLCSNFCDLSDHKSQFIASHVWWVLLIPPILMQQQYQLFVVWGLCPYRIVLGAEGTGFIS